MQPKIRVFLQQMNGLFALFHPIFLIAFISVLSTTPSASDVLALADFRDWTAEDGKKMRAKLVNVGHTHYTLKKHRDGRTYDVPLDRISEEDKQLVSAANDEIARAKESCMSRGTFNGLPNSSESFWQVAIALGRMNELAELVTSQYKSSKGAIKITARNFRRESNKSFLVEGDHVMIRVIVSDKEESLQISSDKLQVVRKTKVAVRRRIYSSYGYNYEYDTRTKLYKMVLCTLKQVYQPAVGSEAPYKLAKCAVEQVGVGDYLVFTLTAN